MRGQLPIQINSLLHFLPAVPLNTPFCKTVITTPEITDVCSLSRTWNVTSSYEHTTSNITPPSWGKVSQSSYHQPVIHNFLPVCFDKCFFKWILWLKDSLQWSHLNGFEVGYFFFTVDVEGTSAAGVDVTKAIADVGVEYLTYKPTITYMYVQKLHTWLAMSNNDDVTIDTSRKCL